LGCDADHRRHGYLFLLIGDPLWLIAANLTYLIGISMPSIAVWLLRQNQPEMTRPYRAERPRKVPCLRNERLS